MNDPINKRNIGWLQRKLIFFHHKYSHSTRCEILGNKLAEIISLEIDCSTEFKVLDFGCGDMKIASVIKKNIPTINLTGCDILDRNESMLLPFKFEKYEGNKLPFPDKSFSIVLISDVLHHIPENRQLIYLMECLRVGEKVIIKDSFEKGYFSRLILIIMDIIGNWAYGVRIPNRYFKKGKFIKMCKDNAIDCQIMVSELELYNHLPKVVKLISPPDLHFIAVLTKN